MNNEFESIIKAVKNIKLNEKEKAKMRVYLFENLSQEIEQNQSVTNLKTIRLYEYYQYIKNYYFMHNKYKLVPAITMILVVVLAGGTSAFAEKAVPGDLLYGIKVSVNEPIAGIFAFSKVEKVEWQERLVERRLGEAQKLVAQNNLDENTRVYLENKIQKQVDQFNVGSNNLAWGGEVSASVSDDLNLRLQAVLKAHENVLAGLSNETNIGDVTKQEAGKLLVVMSDSQNIVRDNHLNLESKENANPLTVSTIGVVSTTPDDLTSTLAKQDTAVGLLNSIKLLYQKERINLSINVQNKIDAKLVEVESVLEEGKTLIASADYVNATAKFQLAINLENTTKLLMLSNSIKGDIEDDMGISNDDDNDIEEDDFGNDDNKNILNLLELESSKVNQEEFDD